jgi:hypothetical protein
MQNVQSFDIYDTIIARNVENPSDIFGIVEKKSNIVNFKQNRIKAAEQNGLSFDTIYNAFQSLTSYDKNKIEELKNIEIQTEIENSYLILPVYNLIKDGDILVSDMYFNSEQLRKILNSIGFEKKVEIYSSSCGKSKQDGSMYKYLKTKYNILTHYGDNKQSDIIQAQQNGINSKEIDISAPNKYERFFITSNYKEFAFILREFRLKNPYQLDSKEYNLYNEQICVNIPILILLSKCLNNIMINENRNTLLCLTRDGCLIKHIFSTLYPKWTCQDFQSSRIMNKNYNEEYKAYVKKTYNDKNCILFDLQGSFESGRKLFMEIFGFLPRVHIFLFNNTISKYDKLTSSINYGNENIEKLNADIVGTLTGMENGQFIRAPLEYKLSDVLIYKKTVLDFCDFIKKKRISDNIYPPDYLINDFFDQNKDFKSTVSDKDVIENMENIYTRNNSYILYIILIGLFLIIIFFKQIKSFWFVVLYRIIGRKIYKKKIRKMYLKG